MASFHPWFEKVIGGVSIPRILILGDNLCDNPRFIENYDGWTPSVVSSNITFERIADKDSYGDYMLRIAHTIGAKVYMQYQKTVTESIRNKKFLISLRINSRSETNQNYKITIFLLQNNVELYSKEILIDKFTKKISFIASTYITGTTPTPTTLQLRIFASNSILSDIDMRVDDVYINEIEYDYSFSQPQETYIAYEKILSGSNELNDGKLQEFNKSWRPNFFATYTLIERGFEIQRQRIAEADLLFIFPHQDFDFGFFGIWNEEFSRRYPFNRFIAHQGNITIKGNELLKGTIHPIEVTGEIPGLYNVSVEVYYNGGDGRPVLNILSKIEISVTPVDYNGNGSGFGAKSPPNSAIRNFVYSDDTTIIISVPVDIEGVDDLGVSVILDFVKWQKNGIDYSTNDEIVVTINDDADYKAFYVARVISGSAGYGYDYAQDYGGGL